MKKKISQELKNAQDYISSFLETWKQEGKQQKELVPQIKAYCRQQNIHQFSLSAPALSKIKNKSEDISEITYTQFARILKEWNAYRAPIEELPPIHAPFRHLVGKYEIYHKSRHKETIIKNILEISQDGKAFVHSASRHTHYGIVNIFEGTMVSINFHALEDKDFHYQLLMNLKGYLEYGLSKVTHIWAISTTITLEQSPMANLRIICPLHNALNKVSPKTFNLHSSEFEAYVQKYPALAIFKSQNPTRLLCPYEINEIIG